MIQVSAQEVARAPKDALVYIQDGVALILKRDSQGGVDDPQVKDGASFFPISMLKNEETFLEGGDWTTIPYIRSAGKLVEANANYHAFEIQWV